MKDLFRTTIYRWTYLPTQGICIWLTSRVVSSDTPGAGCPVPTTLHYLGLLTAGLHKEERRVRKDEKIQGPTYGWWPQVVGGPGDVPDNG